MHGLGPNERFAVGAKLVNDPHVRVRQATHVLDLGEAGKILQDAPVLFERFRATVLCFEMGEKLVDHRADIVLGGFAVRRGYDRLAIQDLALQFHGTLPCDFQIVGIQ